MVICGHQLGSSDDFDWLFSSSAGTPIGGSSNTVELLQSIMLNESSSSLNSQSKKETKFLQSQKISLSVAKEREIKYLKHREDRISLHRKSSNLFHDFSDFDEAEHVDGCPVKWLYRRQSSDSWRSSSTSRKEEVKKSIEKQKPGVRDKTPREIQIKKMGLKKRQGRHRTKITSGNKNKNTTQTNLKENQETNDEEKIKKLAAKLNFKPFYDEDSDDESSDDEIRFSNFLQPRPLTGQRPWLCILLAPRLDSCCTSTPAKVRIPDRTRSPAVSIRSLVLPEIAKPRPISTPLISSASRWAGQKKTSKPVKEIKIYQTPPQLVIKLRSVEDLHEQKPNSFLEEDRYYRLKRFLNLDDNITNNVEQNSCKVKKVALKNKMGKEAIQLVSRKVQFSERPGKPMR